MFHVDPRDVYRLVYYLLSGLRCLCGTILKIRNMVLLEDCIKQKYVCGQGQHLCIELHSSGQRKIKYSFN